MLNTEVEARPRGPRPETHHEQRGTREATQQSEKSLSGVGRVISETQLKKNNVANSCPGHWDTLICLGERQLVFTLPTWLGVKAIKTSAIKTSEKNEMMTSFVFLLVYGA